MFILFVSLLIYIANLPRAVCNISAQAAEMLLNIVTGADLN